MFFVCSITLWAKAQEPDLTAPQLRLEASRYAQLHRLPPSAAEWATFAAQLTARLKHDMALAYEPTLPLDLRVTGMVEGEGYAVQHISFQSLPGVLATASLYVPEGTGPFPAVLITHGHWPDGRRAPLFQSVAQVLAKSGYVCLNIDAWGAGERGTVEGQQEYHGSNLGASLLNIGHTLLGVQLTENMRAVDLLASLPYVDANRIGATGASGGGNQTMWLAAMDERILAAVPVVSVGTFQSYVMNSNCVCELLPNGLTYTEEAGVLALTAPRALKIINALEEKNPSFMPRQMLSSYQQAAAVYRLNGTPENIAYHIAAGGHDYSPEMHEHLLGWMDFHLKGVGHGGPRPAPEPHPIDPVRLQTYTDGHRDKQVVTTEQFCRQVGTDLAKREPVSDLAPLRDSLKNVVHFRPLTATRVVELPTRDGWQALAVETSAGTVLPVRYSPPSNGRAYVLLFAPKTEDSTTTVRIDQLRQDGYGVIVADLWGTGEQASAEASRIDGALPPFHTLARSALWLGKTIMGTWAAEIQLISALSAERFGWTGYRMEAHGETALAAAFALALGSERCPTGFAAIGMPYTYVFDRREGIDHFSMATHVPGILQWGDVPTLLAMANTVVTVTGAKTLSGTPMDQAIQQRYQQQVSALAGKLGTTTTLSIR